MSLLQEFTSCPSCPRGSLPAVFYSHTIRLVGPWFLKPGLDPGFPPSSAPLPGLREILHSHLAFSSSVIEFQVFLLPAAFLRKKENNYLSGRISQWTDLGSEKGVGEGSTLCRRSKLIALSCFKWFVLLSYFCINRVCVVRNT